MAWSHPLSHHIVKQHWGIFKVPESGENPFASVLSGTSLPLSSNSCSAAAATVSHVFNCPRGRGSHSNPTSAGLQGEPDSAWGSSSSSSRVGVSFSLFDSPDSSLPAWEQIQGRGTYLPLLLLLLLFLVKPGSSLTGVAQEWLWSSRCPWGSQDHSSDGQGKE